MPDPTLRSSRFAGLALPALRSAGGYFAAKRGVDRVWGDLMVAVLTPIGTRPMRRAFGSGLADLVFAAGTAAADDPAVRLVVTAAAGRWCPQAAVSAVRSQRVAAGPAAGQLQVQVTFAVAGEASAGGAASPAVAAAQAAVRGPTV